MESENKHHLARVLFYVKTLQSTDTVRPFSSRKRKGTILMASESQGIGSVQVSSAYLLKF